MTMHESFTSLQQPLIRALTKTGPTPADPSQTSHLTHRWTLNGQQLHTILGINRALPTLYPTPTTLSIPIPSSAPPSVAPTARLSTIDAEVEDTPEYTWLMIMRHSTQYMRQARTWMSSVYGYTPIITTAPLRRSTSPVKSILKRQTVTPLTSLPSQSWCNMASTLLSCDMWLLMDIQDVWQDMTSSISCTRIERWLMACLAILYGQAHTWILCFGSQLYLDFCSATHDYDYLRTIQMDEKEERKRTVSDVDEEADDGGENDYNDEMIQQRWIMRWRIQDEELEHRIDMEEIQQIPDLDPLMDVERCKLVARFFGISNHAMIMTLQQHDLMYTSHVTCHQFKSLFYHLFQQQLAHPQHTATLESWNDGGLMQRSLTTTTSTSSNDVDHSYTCPRCVIL